MAAVEAARRAGRTSVLLLVKRGTGPEAFVGVDHRPAALERARGTPHGRTRFAETSELGCAPRIHEGAGMAGEPTSTIFIGSCCRRSQSASA